MRLARLFPLALVAAAILYTAVASPSPPPRAGARVVTWNLRNFPGDHDLPWLAAELEALDADVLALQEVRDPARLADVLPSDRYDWIASSHGGRNGQHIVLAWRRSTSALVGPPREYDALSFERAFRPALSGSFRIGKQRLDVMAVHLKARPSGATIRALQWDHLAASVRALHEDAAPLLLVGDFNVTGGTPHDSPEHERARLEATLAGSGLAPIEVGQCTAYWQGVRYDGWFEPSRLDLAFAAGLAGLQPRAWAGTHCRRASCEPLQSTPSRPLRSLASGSDHCPVVIDF